MEYRAISLHQPWASLVVLGIKKYETRSWSTKFRGRLLICSARKFWKEETTKLYPSIPSLATHDFPLGRVLCVVDLANCLKMESYPPRKENIILEDVPELEQLCGDWQTGRYAWELANLMPLPEPIPIKGKQGLWIPESSTITEVEKQLSIG
jgi:hypothetical protein